MPPFHERARDVLPRLTADNYRISSPATWDYNCVAWAVGVTDAWWWPVAGRYWPAGLPREETVAAIVTALGTLGYEPVVGTDLQPGIEKVVVYACGSAPTHVARQLSSGWWTSKLGPSIDIEHDTPDAVAGGEYGEVVAVLGRKRATGTS